MVNHTLTLRRYAGVIRILLFISYWTHIFDWCVVKWGWKNKHYKDTCSKEIGLRTLRILLITPHSIVTTNWEDLSIHLKNHQTCAFDKHNWIRGDPIDFCWRCIVDVRSMELSYGTSAVVSCDEKIRFNISLRFNMFQLQFVIVNYEDEPVKCEHGKVASEEDPPQYVVVSSQVHTTPFICKQTSQAHTNPERSQKQPRRRGLECGLLGSS